MGLWLKNLAIGTPGGKLHDIIAGKLPYGIFGIYLNAGHLIHMDEWLSSPIWPGSQIKIRSGMALQIDIIPSSPLYFSTRMEDGIVIADSTLRDEIRRQFPACFERIRARRSFMTDVLGFEIGEELLPLSNIAGIVPPYFLKPERVFTLK